MCSLNSPLVPIIVFLRLQLECIHPENNQIRDCRTRAIAHHSQGYACVSVRSMDTCLQSNVAMFESRMLEQVGKSPLQVVRAIYRYHIGIRRAAHHNQDTNFHPHLLIRNPSQLPFR